MLEIRAGVFAGRVSPRVRDELWQAAVKGCKSGSCLMLWDEANEQGFSWRSHGDPSYRPIDLDGLKLILKPRRKQVGSSIPPSLP